MGTQFKFYLESPEIDTSRNFRINLEILIKKLQKNQHTNLDRLSTSVIERKTLLSFLPFPFYVNYYLIYHLLRARSHYRLLPNVIIFGVCESENTKKSSTSSQISKFINLTKLIRSPSKLNHALFKMNILVK